jgi:hypothetical protein
MNYRTPTLDELVQARPAEFGEKYYVAYTLKGEAPIMNIDAFETHKLAQAFLEELVESRKAFSVAGVLRFSVMDELDELDALKATLNQTEK